MTDQPPGHDPYSRVQYRRLVAWERRIAREGPFLRALLQEAPDRSVVDLGCGTGEHVAFFADEGARAVGLDRSAAMLDDASSHAAAGRGHFVAGDLREADQALRDQRPFGMGVCIGNVLPHLLEDEDLRAFVRSMAAVLAPGGLLLIQLLNYAFIRAAGVRHLPVNVRPGDGECEIVFLRLVKPIDDKRMLFFPTTLELDPDPDAEVPVRLERSKRLEVRMWSVEEITAVLAEAGFASELYGDMEWGAYDPAASKDLVVVGRTPARGVGPA